jgi:RNA ligase
MGNLSYSNRIEPYLEAIAGCDAFFVAEREYGRIINYRQMGNDVFPDPATAPDSHTAYLWGLRRQCRGLIFDLDGNVLSLGFEKFFNVSEREETLVSNLPFDQPHVIMEKLDGSLVRPIRMPNGGYRLGTKMGPTDVAANAEAWVRKHANYDKFFTDLIAQGYTPLLEWCSRQNRIVIDYPEDRLVLLAVREIRTGDYLPLNMMLELAGEYGVEVVRRYPGTPDSMQHLIEETRGIQDQEGWVVAWPHLRVKIKGAQYVAVHRAKEGILRENGVIDMMLDEKLDDVKAFLMLDDRAALEDYESRFWAGIQDTVGKWQLAYLDVKSQFGTDRKGFALDWAPRFDAHLRGAIFKAWDDAQFDFREAVLQAVRKSITTQAKTDENRYLWGSAVWDGGRMRVED